MFTDRLFTGQRQIAELGIYHYNARFYSPKLGRFLSADTMMSGFANPQNLNRFAYAANNPVRYTDPTGHYCVGDLEGCRDETGAPVNGAPLYLHQDDDGGGGGDEDEGDTGGGGGGDYCATHPGSCGLPIPPLTPIGTLPGDDYCATHPGSCGLPIPNPNPVVEDLVPPSFTQTSAEDEFSPMVSVGGILLFVQMGILDLVLGYGIVLVASAGPLGLAAELILLPLEITSIGLTIYASQVAATGTTDHDPIPLWHAIFPNFLPYEPKE